MSESVFGLPLSDEATRAFEAIRTALETGQVDPYNRDAFLLPRPVVEMIHASRPGEGFGEGIDPLAALIHLLFLFWMNGEQVVELGPSELEVVMRGVGQSVSPSVGQSVYVRAKGRRIWGSPTEAGPEPLDGWYAARKDDRLMVAALFGGRPDREGISVVAASGPEPVGLAREDGTALFSPTLPGGAQAGLYSLIGMEELLALAWRVEHWRAEKA